MRRKRHFHLAFLPQNAATRISHTIVTPLTHQKLAPQLEWQEPSSPGESQSQHLNRLRIKNIYTFKEYQHL